MVEELYNNGTSELTMKKASLRNNTSSSIADLKILKEKEEELLKTLEMSVLDPSLITKSLEEDGYSIDSILYCDVFHPIDSYNLIKRTSRTWPRIRKLLENVELNQAVLERVDSIISEFPTWEHSRIASALGLVNVQVYYDLDPAHMVDGIVHDKLKNITYQAQTRLNVGDAKLIAQVAEDNNHYDSALQWLRLFPQLIKRYKKLVRIHNDLLAYHPDVAVTKEIFVFNETLDESIQTSENISVLLEKGRTQCPPFQGTCRKNIAEKINFIFDLRKDIVNSYLE